MSSFPFHPLIVVVAVGALIGLGAPASAKAPSSNTGVPLTVESLNSASLVPGQGRKVVGVNSVARAQVLLDRANFSVGPIDGRWGKNSEIAVYWFQRENGIQPTGDVDEKTFRALLQSGSSLPAVAPYALTADDTKGPFTKLPEDVYEKEKLSCLCYESLAEMLSEKFHTTQEFLALLNPGKPIDGMQAGQQLLVPNVRGPQPKEARKDVAKIQVSVKGWYLHALDAQGNIIFHAPTTLGSKYDPSPNEATKIVGIAFDPHFHYQPKLFADVPDTNAEANLQPGPNSPVGKVWMALSKPHFGIHGTNDPDSIGYASSHGCVRLANWDALDLARRSGKGIEVDFIDTKSEDGPAASSSVTTSANNG